MQQEILKSFESGKVLVFPTEVSARSNLDSFVLETGGVCFADRAVSWDTFLRESRPIPKNMKKAAFQHRLLFAQRFAGEGDLNGTLKYFMPSGVGDTKAFVKPLAVALPHFFRLDGNKSKEMLPATCAHDIDIVLPLYRKFLDENGLYEEEAYEPDFSWAKETHVLVYPQANSDPMVEKAVAVGIPKVDVPLGCGAEVHVYENSVRETRDVMRRIKALMENGTPSNSITITCAAESYRPHLEEEASKRGIRLVFASGRRLSDYSVAGVFSELANLCGSGFDFNAFRKLVTDPVIPFKNRYGLLAVLDDAVEKKISFSDDRWHVKLNPKHKDTFRKLESYSKGVCYATSFEKLTSAFRGFQDDFLFEGGFGSLADKVQVGAFQRCMELLEELDDMQRTMGPERLDAVGFFSDVLSATVYTPKSDRNAIAVYTYPVTCPPAGGNCFVIGLTDDASQKRRSPIPFYTSLDDGFEQATGSRDITADIVRSYAREGVWISCALSTFDGAAAVPSAFLLDGGRKVDEDNDPNDEFRVEEMSWRESKVVGGCGPSQLQRDWNIRGVSSFAAAEAQDAMATEPKVEVPVGMSATSMSSYEKCPFRWLCKYSFKVDDKDLDCIQNNAAEIGTLLHNSYERFMKKWVHVDSMQSDAALEDLKAIFDEELDAYAKSPKGPDSLHVIRIRNEHRDELGKIVEVEGFEKLSGSDHVMSESRMEYTDGKVAMKGSPDCVFRFGDGTYAVVDFKKSSVDADSIQLGIYATLMQHDESFGKVPAKAMFYNIAKGEFVVQWTNAEEYKQKQAEFQKRIDAFVENLGKGNFTPTPSKDSCAHCPYRQVCRRRYVIK